ncbi:hypothetical protein FRC02_002051 [Tulasnella sp. 418]|nr:hypothetical protein FRC02_002051 [Tulasnella sp. 418]
MMDGRALYPKGWHPQALGRAPNGRLMSTVPKRRAVGGVRYYLIDYGISIISQSEVTGILGQKQAPELNETTPYNPFKVDIWLLGSCFGCMITEKFRNVEWLNTLVEAMTETDPSARPTAIECVSQFDAIKAQIKFLARAQRLHPPKTELRVLQAVRDTTYLISEAIWTLKFRAKKSLTPFQPTEKGSEPQAVAAEEAKTDGQASVKESAAVPQDTEPSNNTTIEEPSKPNAGNPEH